jgi:hypothetical protein
MRFLPTLAKYNLEEIRSQGYEQDEGMRAKPKQYMSLPFLTVCFLNLWWSGCGKTVWFFKVKSGITVTDLSDWLGDFPPR